MAIIQGTYFSKSSDAYNHFRPHLSYYYFNLKYRTALKNTGHNMDIEYILDDNGREPLYLEIDGIYDTFYNHCDRLDLKPSSISRRITDLKGDIEKAFKEFNKSVGYYSINLINKYPERKSMPVNIYLIRFNMDGSTYYKFGITKNRLKDRFKGLTYITLLVIPTTLENAVYFEDRMKNTYKHLLKKPSEDFCGKTEVFYKPSMDDIRNIKKIMKKVKKSVDRR